MGYCALSIFYGVTKKNKNMKYIITLKPVTPYFWGLEQVSELGNKRNYYLESAIFPQQTAILGMLRYQALAQYGFLSIPNSAKADARRLIGESSFNSANTNGYGAIQKISSLQLQKGDDNYLFRSKDYFSLKEDKAYPVRKSWLELAGLKPGEFVQALIPKSHFAQLIYRKDAISPTCVPLPWIDKNEFKELLILDNHILAETDIDSRSVQSKFVIDVDNVIQRTGRVGIEKAWEGNTKSNAYYKQYFRELQETKVIADKTQPEFKTKMMLNADWKFTFKMEWDETTGFEFNPTERFITMGGEQSVFLLSAEPDTSADPIDILPTIPDLEDNEVYKLLLTSDAFISEEEQFYQLPVLVNGSTVRFRNFISRVDTTKQYYVRGEKHSGFTQSTPSYLLKRGSLLYFTDTASLNNAIQLINQELAFKAIGYNYYKIETEKYHQL
jgi:CRISPR-associated protein Cmr3